jgi:hypothetical protein
MAGREWNGAAENQVGPGGAGIVYAPAKEGNLQASATECWIGCRIAIRI